MVRVTENYDWVIVVLLLSVVALLIVFQYLQRDSRFLKFFSQNFIDSGNIFPTWLVVSGVYVLLFATFVSKFLPVIPAEVEKISVMGYSLNKMGYVLLISSLYYVARFFLTFFFYSSIGEDKKWARLYFVTSKFYMFLSFVLIGGILLIYFFDYSGLLLLRVSFVVAFVLFVFKQFFYLFNRNYILPNNWYYKILYICTLQIIPILALWKTLFI